MASDLVREEIWAFIWLISGSEGSAVLMASLRAVRSRTSGDRPGVKFLKYPAGIVSLETLLITF